MTCIYHTYWICTHNKYKHITFLMYVHILFYVGLVHITDTVETHVWIFHIYTHAELHTYMVAPYSGYTTQILCKQHLYILSTDRIHKNIHYRYIHVKHIHTMCYTHYYTTYFTDTCQFISLSTQTWSGSQVHFHTGPLQNWGQTWGLGHTEELEQMWALASRGNLVLKFITLALLEGSFSVLLMETTDLFQVVGDLVTKCQDDNRSHIHMDGAAKVMQCR